nr:CENP-X/MHF2 family protein [Vibrio cholerae]
MFNNDFLTRLFENHFTQMHHTNTRPTPKAVKLTAKTQNDQG